MLSQYYTIPRTEIMSNMYMSHISKKRHSQECLSLAAESAAPTASANDD